MRNLKNIALEEFQNFDALAPSAIAWDATQDSIICAFGPAEASSKITLKRIVNNGLTSKPEYGSIASWDAPCPSRNVPIDEIICLQHFSDTATSCIILAGGDLVVVREDPQHEEEIIEIVGSVDAGIAAAAWAPDEELLAIVTNADTLILMTRNFEPVTDVALTADDLKASKHVSVGWGKKETQFQGKRAKALRDPTMPETVDEGKLSLFDTDKTSISWRGDGAFLAVNRVVPNSRRVIRILTREGIMESASEPVDGLEYALSWRPAGNLITGVQRLADRLDVVFFERNGLRHGEFSLRLSEEEMETWASEVSLCWNIDSTVLAVSFRDRVQLWTMRNYHYYLKQEILLDGELLAACRCISWHPEKSLRLCAASKDTILDLEYIFDVDKGSTIRPHDNGIVAVIDGKSLRLTPLKYAMIPPPMSFSEIETSSNIIDCSISLTGNHIVVLTADGIELYKWDFRSRPAAPPKKIASRSFDSEPELWTGTRHRGVLIRGEYRITIFSQSNSGQSKLTTYIKEGSEGDLINDDEDEAIHSGKDGQLRGVFTDVSHELIWGQTSVGVSCLYPDGLCVSSAVHPSLQILNGTINEELLDGYNEGPLQHTGLAYGQTQVLCLSRKGELYSNDRLITRGCTSFVCTNAHLIFTTSLHLLKFAHIGVSDELEIPDDTPEVDERCRSMERGAKLITVIPSIYAVILQMPRGNLETVYPRALVLAGIRQHLDDKDFKSAFLACQNHQVDMNIIYDYRPNIFMGNIAMFVDQLRKVSRIDLFLSKLSEDDVSKTLYKDTLARRAERLLPQETLTSEPNDMINGASNEAIESGKVNRICDALLSYFEPRISKHLQNMITAHVCKRPPDHVSALELVASLRKTDAERAEEAVSHLCFLSDVNRLYDTALSLYDLPLTLLVAQQAQRDPREYMPFLQSFHALPHLRRNFRIDDHLRNHAKALVSLHALAAHEEVEAYTIKHALYPQALKLYRYDLERQTTITRLHATYLTSQSNHLSSAIASESLSDYALASSSYAKCSPPQWREALHCASMIQPPLPRAQIESLASQLATTLTDQQRDYRSASQIHLDYLHNIPTSVRLLCRGSYFSEALRLLSLHDLTNLTPDLIDTALAEKSGEISELIADCRAQLLAQVPRIHELRTKKAADPLAFFGGDPTTRKHEDGDAADMPDNISIAATDSSTLGGQSLFTRYTSHHGTSRGQGRPANFAGTVASGATHQTSRTRRREERKRARGKKGSVYEEEYLVGSVRRVVERVNATHAEVGRLVMGLRRRGLGMEMAQRLDMVLDLMHAVEKDCRRAVSEVWGEDGAGAVAGDVQGMDMVGDRPRGADGVLWESRVESMGINLGQGMRGRPEVKVWKSGVE